MRDLEYSMSHIQQEATPTQQAKVCINFRKGIGKRRVSSFIPDFFILNNIAILNEEVTLEALNIHFQFVDRQQILEIKENYVKYVNRMSLMFSCNSKWMLVWCSSCLCYNNSALQPVQQRNLAKTSNCLRLSKMDSKFRNIKK